jgi:hypothetical protein
MIDTRGENMVVFGKARIKRAHAHNMLYYMQVLNFES